MRTSVSKRKGEAARRVGVHGGQRPVVAGVHRLEHVQALLATALTDDDAVGSHAQRVAHQVADADRTLALDVGRPDSSRTTCSCWSCSSTASSMVTIRSPSGMNDESTLSRVVLPVPVPPETITLSRASTALSSSAISGDRVPKLMRSSTVKGSLENFRIERRPAERQRRNDRVDAGSVGQGERRPAGTICRSAVPPGRRCGR